MLVATMLTLAACGASTAGGTSGGRAAQQDCAQGTFDVTSIETSTLLRLNVDDRGIRGTGGSLQLRLRSDGTWRLSDDGSDEMRIVAGPWTGGFSADGWVEGRYERSGNAWRFTHNRASGTASLRLHMLGDTEVPLRDMSPSIVPDGRASITCGSDGITLESRPDAISLSLHRTRSGAGPRPALWFGFQ
jgi:hypothetical protein